MLPPAPRHSWECALTPLLDHELWSPAPADWTNVLGASPFLNQDQKETGSPLLEVARIYRVAMFDLVHVPRARREKWSSEKGNGENSKEKPTGDHGTPEKGGNKDRTAALDSVALIIMLSILVKQGAC